LKMRVDRPAVVVLVQTSPELRAIAGRELHVVALSGAYSASLLHQGPGEIDCVFLAKELKTDIVEWSGHDKSC